MSGQTTRPQVPEGRIASYGLTTRQMAPTDKGFVGYETIWDSVQTEAAYQTPSRP